MFRTCDGLGHDIAGQAKEQTAFYKAARPTMIVVPARRESSRPRTWVDCPSVLRYMFTELSEVRYDALDNTVAHPREKEKKISDAVVTWWRIVFPPL